MVTFLTQEYLDREVELAPAGAAGSVRVQHVVPGAPGGVVRYVSTVVDGRLTGQSLGEADEGDEVDVTVTTRYPDAVLVLRGDLDPNAAFMAGRIKVAGSTGKLLTYLAFTSADDCAAMRRALAESTEL